MAQHQRRGPRIPTTVTIELWVDNGQSVRASVCDISRGGLLCELDDEAPGFLFPDGLERRHDNQARAGQALDNLALDSLALYSLAEVDLTLPLPFVFRAPQRISVHCKVLRIAPQNDSGARVALGFMSFLGNSREHIETFILERQRLE